MFHSNGSGSVVKPFLPMLTDVTVLAPENLNAFGPRQVMLQDARSLERVGFVWQRDRQGCPPPPCAQRTHTHIRGGVTGGRKQTVGQPLALLQAKQDTCTVVRGPEIQGGWVYSCPSMAVQWATAWARGNTPRTQGQQEAFKGPRKGPTSVINKINTHCCHVGMFGLVDRLCADSRDACWLLGSHGGWCV